MSQVEFDEELTERENRNISSIAIFAAGDCRFAMAAIIDSQQRLALRSKDNRAERAEIYLAQLCIAYASYVTSFNSPKARVKIRQAWGMKKQQTSAKWLNEIIKAATYCTRKEASRRSLVIRLALHHSVDVADFPAFFKARGNEAKCVAEYKRLRPEGTRKPSPRGRQSQSDDATAATQTGPSTGAEKAPTECATPLTADHPKVVDELKSQGFRRDFVLKAGNPKVALDIDAALRDGMQLVVGPVFVMRAMIDRYGITALKVWKAKT